jgi:hypothetical protein
LKLIATFREASENFVGKTPHDIMVVCIEPLRHLHRVTGGPAAGRLRFARAIAK